MLAKVVMADINKEAGEKALAKLMELISPELRATNPAIFAQVDVSKEIQVKDAVTLAEKTFGIQQIDDRKA